LEQEELSRTVAQSGVGVEALAELVVVESTKSVLPMEELEEREELER
jgi:hypothetical protein